MTSSSPPTEGLATRSLGGFVLRELLSAGGVDDVYLAEQAGLNREAVVKVLRPEDVTADRIQRFLREAQLASRLDHPYAAHIYAFGAEPDGVLWIAMEHVRGSSLRAVLETQGPMSIERFVPFFERICEVVHTAHEQEILHRDLKPDNIMVISRAGRLLPKLIDFGIARATGSDEPPVAPVDLGALDRPAEVVTQRGTILGSPPYMAPELWLNAHTAVAASDQYALGALAYEVLTGKLAFSGRTMLDVARAHSRGKLPPLGDGFAPGLDAVLKRSLARAPADRYGNVLELAQALRDASGVNTIAIEIPQIDEALRVSYLTGAPQPIADAVAAYDAARNAHQAREALRSLIRIAGWYVGLLALASRTRVGSGGASDSEHVQVLLRDLRRQGLTPGGWIALARQLTQPFVRLPDTHPVPELVLLLHPASGADPLAAALEGSLSESLPDSSEEAASQAIARELPVAVGVLRSLVFLLEYRLVAPRDGRAESWMGVRTGAKRTVTLSRAIPGDRLVIVDELGGPLLAVWPLLQLHVPVPGHAEQLFLLAGPGRQGARLVSSPHNFEHRDDDLWDWFRGQLFDQDDPGDEAAVEDTPYRGLSSYTNSDAPWFFGRERESEALVNRLKLESFVAVVGPSGVGKSSFVHAGVVPTLTGWRVVTTRPGRAPLAQLATQLAHLGLELDAASDQTVDALARRITSWATDHGGLLIVIDQFEEVFTLCSSIDERVRFVQVLLAATRTLEVAVRVVITLRDDFLIRAEQLPGLDQALARGLQLLGPLGAPALERILVEPARRAGYEFEDPTLPARMVQEILGTPAAVALLSFTASRMWELRDRHFRQLPRKAYDALGGVGGALARHADATVDAMPPAERALARKAFRHLVTFEGTRAVLGRDELEQLLGGGSDAQRLTERLIEARLVSSAENEHGEIVIEIVHEALLGAWPRLVEWRREDVEGSRFHEQLRAAAKQWQDRGRPRGLLWRGDALAEYQLWRKRQVANLTPAEAAFGAASVSDAARGRRIRRALLAVALVTTAIFIAELWRANSTEQRLLRDATFEQARLLMLGDNKLGAIPQLSNAYQMGEIGSPIRLLIEEASRSMRAQRAVFDGGGKLWDVAFGADGKTIATASADGVTGIWDAATGAPLGVIKHEGIVLSVAISPDSKLVVGGGRDGKARVWRIIDRREVATLDLGEPIRHVMFSPDGKRVLTTGLRTGLVKLWGVPDGKLVAELHAHHAEAGGAFCAGGDCFATWDHEGTVVVWDAQTLAQRARYARPAGIMAGAVDRSGSVVAVAFESGRLELLRPDGVIEKLAHDQLIYDVAMSPDGMIVATASNDSTARLWDTKSGGLRVALAGHHANVTSVRFSPGGDLVATTSADGTARLWSPTTGAVLGELAGHTNIVFAAAFGPDGNRLVTASWDHRAIVWDVAAARQFRSIETARVDLTQPAPLIAFRGDSKRIAMAGADRSLVIIEVASGRVVCRAPVAQPINRIAWSLDGNAVATVADDSVANVWSAGCELRHALAHPHVTSVAFGPVNQIATGGTDKAVRLWNADGSLAATLPDYVGEIDDLGFRPDSREIYALTTDQSAVVLEDLGSHHRRVFRTAASLQGVVFDARRHRVIAAGIQEVWIWDELTGIVLARLEPGGPLFGVRLSADGETIVGVGGLSPYAWSADTWQRLGALDGHSDLVVSGDFIDDRIFVTGSRDGTTRVWDLKKLQPLVVQHAASAVIVSPDRSVVVLSDVGGTRLWSPRSPTPDLDQIDHLRSK